MTTTGLQEMCEVGQGHLMRTEYVQAERVLAEAERLAREAGDWDTLARLYMPLQETRRQRRLRCGEGEVRLDLIAEGPGDALDGRRVLENHPQGQLLVAGWGTIAPAIEVRRLAAEHQLYVETFLAAVYPITGGGRALAVVPTEEVGVPTAEERGLDALLRLLPAHSLVYRMEDLPKGVSKGTPETFAMTTAMWEKLHLPFLAAADASVEPLQKIDGYRQTIRVDYACEFAHQRLSVAAREMGRR